MERKYHSEGALIVETGKTLFFPVEYLGKIDSNIVKDCHLYAILAIDEFYFVPEKTIQSEEGVSFSFVTRTEGKERIFNLPVLPLIKNYDHRQLRIDHIYPNNVIKIVKRKKDDPAQEEEIMMTAQEILLTYASVILDKIEFEVMYIGQAYGKTGNRSAYDRLENHETLQRILREALLNHPNKHIYILLMQMNYSNMILFDGANRNVLKSYKESEKHLRRMVKNPAKESQVINISEAAMIRYFKPKCNNIFVDNFPNIKTTSYKQFYDLDYNEIIIGINLQQEGFPQVQLYTENSRIDSPDDLIRFSLATEQDRKSIFEIF